jgi:hypothetical protein
MDEWLASLLFSCVASFSREDYPNSTNTTRGMAVCTGAPARYVVYWLAAQVFSLSRDEACMDRESKREVARQPKPPPAPPNPILPAWGNGLSFTPLSEVWYSTYPMDLKQKSSRMTVVLTGSGCVELLSKPSCEKILIFDVLSEGGYVCTSDAFAIRARIRFSYASGVDHIGRMRIAWPLSVASVSLTPALLPLPQGSHLRETFGIVTGGGGFM